MKQTNGWRVVVFPGSNSTTKGSMERSTRHVSQYPCLFFPPPPPPRPNGPPLSPRRKHNTRRQRERERERERAERSKGFALRGFVVRGSLYQYIITMREVVNRMFPSFVKRAMKPYMPLAMIPSTSKVMGLGAWGATGAVAAFFAIGDPAFIFVKDLVTPPPPEE
ncbi:hypothetical protein A3770_14p73230 [Chloropicon primus]|uniref:Uncharacterized protein n=1 Tax=Chloropicon primus TaxID=1764295 RepID=A0A5B8MYS3_9CHLO|nr:hypothetical protein A3770_14p73230 [Chloropicon primus]|eukprot:QDZ24805.1 hypothetical protein A3770_14p73230 [Chloropicon primus]